MILKDRGNVPTGSSSMSHIYDIVSVVYIDSCVVSLFPFLGNCGSTSGAIYFAPGIYLISRPHSYNMSLHRKTLTVLKFYTLNFMVCINIYTLY